MKPKPQDNPSAAALAFYALLIVCGLLIVGRLDYADQVFAENERLQDEVAFVRIQCPINDTPPAAGAAHHLEM